MNFKLIAVGKLARIAEILAKEYISRLQKYCTISIIEIKESTPANEGKQLLSLIKDKEYAVLFDVRGKTINSEELALFIKKQQLSTPITFIIGGSEGVSNEVLQRANRQISLSAMTFPHQLARIIILEQIYRAFTIIRGEKYHK